MMMFPTMGIAVPNWTSETILALAPDSSSARAGRELASPRKWVSLGANERSLWGECQGSGASPYQTQIDLSEPAFKCSCPSRKFPCKHGLALFLLFDSAKGSFTESEPPDWVTKWIDSRTVRAEKKAQAVELKPPPDPVAQAKRAAQREEKVSAGIDELARWLSDLMRSGLADAQPKSYRYWDSMAARLIDSQAPGLARMVKDLGAAASSGPGWQVRLVERIGRLNLLVRSWRRLAEIPENVQADVRAQIGFTINQSELIKQPGIADTWQVTGVSIEEEDALLVRHAWLCGRSSQRLALILNFAPPGQPLDSVLVPGVDIRAELVYYPSAVPLRAILKEQTDAFQAPEPPSRLDSLWAAESAYRRAAAANPWLGRYPLLLSDAFPAKSGERWWIQDTEHRLPLRLSLARSWKLAALTGGRPADLCAEWDGEMLLPLTAWTAGRAWPL